MTWLGPLVALAVLQGAASTDAERRSVQVSVKDSKGSPVAGLVADEVAILENGAARDLVSFAPDERPLTVAVVVDTSVAVDSGFRLSMYEPLVAFVRRLPEGARYTIWVTGERPRKLFDLTSDRSEAASALKMVPPMGGNMLLDAIAEASEELSKAEGERSVLVVVTASGPDLSYREREQAVADGLRYRPLVYGVRIQEGEGAEFLYDYVLSELADKTGGLFELVLSFMSVGAGLDKVEADLRSQYRLTYATLPDIKKRKLEVRVARDGARVRVGPVAP